MSNEIEKFDPSKLLFNEIANGLPGCWADNVRINRIVIEANTCPHCWKPLQYKGWSNAEVYRAFGICQPCGFAREFYREGVETAAAKKIFQTI